MKKLIFLNFLGGLFFFIVCDLFESAINRSKKEFSKNFSLMSRKLLVLEFIFHEKKYFHTNEIRKKTYFVEIFFVSKIFDFP